MSKLFLALFVVILHVSAFAQPQGVSFRATNGIGFGTTTIGGRLLATNTVANGGSNYIFGSLLIGKTNSQNAYVTLGTELLEIYNIVTNPPTHVETERIATTVGHTAINSNLIHSGLVVLARVATNNTSDWTNSQYPQLRGVSSAIQPSIGSSGNIRRVAPFAASIAGPFAAGANIQEAVLFWGDTANALGDYLVGVKITGLEKATNNTGIYLGIEQEYYSLPGNWGVCSDLTYPNYFGGHVSIGSTNASSLTNALSVVAGTLTTKSKAMSITGTLANASSSQTGSEIIITGAGSTATFPQALYVSLNAGYTGSSSTYGTQIGNSSSGTGASGWTGSSANYGVIAGSGGAGSGHAIAVLGRASSSSILNVGVFGRSVLSTSSPLLNVGVAGHALSATDNVGGFFGLLNTAPTTLTSAALMADNGAVAADILTLRDNGSVVGGVANGGVFYGDASGMSNAISLVAGANITLTPSDPRTITIASSGGGGEAFWWTNTAAASSVSNAFNVLAGGYYGNALGVSNAVDLFAGNCIVITPTNNNRGFIIAVGNPSTNYIFFYTNSAVASSTYTPYNVGVGGYVAPTNGVLWQGGAQLTNIYTATATLNFGNLATIGCADLTMAVTGAALGDVVDLGVPNVSVVANSSYSAWVSAADTVTVRFCALISGDPDSGVFRAEVHKWK